jgi:pre-mRNA-splicing factor ATP-dependent RNA helicase DHX15/PRP43
MTTINNNIGILDPDGLNPNPLTNLPYSDLYKELSKKWREFPAYDSAMDTIQDIIDNQVLLVISGTGSGKTVLFPKYTLHALDYKGKIGITLPKQIVAKSAAEFAAKTLDVELGEQVGYQYKGSDKKSRGSDPNLLYATDGTIVARLLNDSLLSGFDAIIIDEAHERKIQIDFLLYLLRNVVKARPKFKLIIMSATIDAKLFESYFATQKFKTIDIGGKTNFPIESIFTNTESNPNNYIEEGKKIIAKLMSTYSELDLTTKINDILFFVTSINETIDTREELKKLYPMVKVMAVYAGISDADQNEVQNKVSNDRRIIISTNVAESSLTVDGIKYVIDAGYELSSYDDPTKHAKVLEKKLITNAQARQRMGRAGRTEAGICYHLYTKNEFENSMAKFPTPSIRTSDITSESLRLMKESKTGDVTGLLTVLSSLIEPPREVYIRAAVNNMEQLKLIDNGKLNKLGELIADMQLDIQSGLCLIIAYKFKCFKEVLLIITAIETIKTNINDLFRVPKPDANNLPNPLYKKFLSAKDKLSHELGDIITIYKILTKYAQKVDTGKSATIDEFIYNNFLNKNTLDKITHNFKRVFYKNKDRMRDNAELITQLFPDEVDYEISLEVKIVASMLYGLRLNTVNKKNNNYITFHDVKVNVSKDSVLANTSHRSMFYYELFIMQEKSDIKIVSLIPNKSKEIIEKYI